MQLLSLTSEQRTSRRVSDGVIVESFTVWHADVLDAAGIRRTLEITSDTQPTAGQIAALVPVPTELAPTAASGKLAMLALVDQRMAAAQTWDWFSTKAQADGALTAGQKTAIATEAARRYTQTKQAIAQWIQAT